MGGVLGLGLSYSVSAAINKFLGASLSGMTGGSGAISRIPLWLSGSAVVFCGPHRHAGRTFPGTAGDEIRVRWRRFGMNRKMKKRH